MNPRFTTFCNILYIPHHRMPMLLKASPSSSLGDEYIMPFDALIAAWRLLV